MAEERLLGLTPALHMDAKDERVQCQLEINFIDCVVTPLWEHCAHCFPALQPCMERVRANRAAYAALANCSNEEVAQVGLQSLSHFCGHNIRCGICIKHPWAAQYNTWLLIKVTPKGVVISFLPTCNISNLGTSRMSLRKCVYRTGKVSI